MTRALVRAEFHCHTAYSPDSAVKLKDLLETCQRKDIQRLAITDHNTMRGALRAKELDPERVVLAEEILTTEGEILGYFMSEEIPAGLEPMAVVERLKKQGAFISIAHPFDPYRGANWKPETLRTLMAHVDALEVFNARCVKKQFNDDAFAYAQQYGKPGTVGSDAHSLMEVGRANLILPAFNTAEELRHVLPEARFDGLLSARSVHLVSLFAKLNKRIFHTRPTGE